MGEPDVPSLMDDEEDDEGPTRMWVSDEGDLGQSGAVESGIAAKGELVQRLSGERERVDHGLRESDLFDDVLDTGPVSRSAAEPVEGALVELNTKRSAASVATMQLDQVQVDEAVAQARRVSTAPAPRSKGSLSLPGRVLLVVAALAVAAAAAAWALSLLP